MTNPAISTLAPGTVFAGDYRILRPLSSGGMGAVYVALQISTDRERALKVMLGELAGNEDAKRRFAQEARIGAQIASEHVVEVVGAGIEATTGTPWLAMELLHGEDLAALVARQGPLGHAFVHELFLQLSHAVGAAHSRQIIHRDLKPENIFLATTNKDTAPFKVKILDFGIAKLLGQVRTSSTGALGTPLFMAPEQTSTQGSISAAADVWAMGLIAFAVLTGKNFWRSAENAEASSVMVLREVVFDPIPSATERAREIGSTALPPGFDAWFAKCLSRDPSLRFPDANVAFREFSRLLSSAAIGTGPTLLSHSAGPPAGHPHALPSAPPRAPARAPSRAWIFAAGAAFVVLGIGIAAVLGVFSPPHHKTRRARPDDADETSRATAVTTSVLASAVPAPHDSASATTVRELEVVMPNTSAPLAVVADDPTALESPHLDVDVTRAVEGAPLYTVPLPGVFDWVEAGTFRVPNPGWRVFRRDNDGMFLAAPDGQGDLIIHLYSSQSDVDALIRGSRVKQWKWRPGQPRTLGPDALPALLGKGSAVASDATPVTLFYALVRGDPKNLIIICVAKTARQSEDFTICAGIIGNLKRR